VKATGIASIQSSLALREVETTRRIAIPGAAASQPRRTHKKR